MLQLINQLQTAQPGVVASNIIGAVQEGQLDPLEAMAALDAMKRVHDEVRKGIEDNVITALEKTGGKAVHNGVKFTIAETGTKYDYTVSPQWQRLNEAVDKATAERKQHEDLLKTIKSQTVLTDPATGDTFELHGIPKSSKTSFKVELPR